MIDSQWRAVEGHREWKELADIITADHEQATDDNARIGELD